MVKHDFFGPEKLLEVYDQESKMHGFLVLDNTWFGPAKGGIRMTPSVNLEEVFHLARTMTYKNALADLPFGGGKAGIISPNKHPTKEERLKLMAAFSHAIKDLAPEVYIAGPDVNTGEDEMAKFVEVNGDPKSATGKPESLNGLPHELGSTGFGVVQAILETTAYLKKELGKMKVAVAGFGNVGTFVADLLAKEGANIVAVSDSGGAIFRLEGLDLEEVRKAKKEFGTVAKTKGGQKLTSEEIFFLPVDILVPAALGGVITDKNVKKIQAKIIAEGANLPVRPDAELVLNKKGVVLIPDIIANAGGVISSYAEHMGYDAAKMFRLVEEKIRTNVRLILDKSQKENSTTRRAALDIAHDRLEATKR